MSRSTVLIENLQKSGEIRAEKLIEIVRRCFGQQNPVGFVAPPVTNRARHPTFHACQESPQVLFLARERRFQYPLENLFMTELQSLLHGLIWIKRGKARVFISPVGKIPQGRNVGKPGKLPGNARKSRLRKVLNDPAVLLKLCKRSHDAKCSVFGTFSSAEPRQSCSS